MRANVSGIAQLLNAYDGLLFFNNEYQALAWCQSEPRPPREGPIIFKPTETKTILSPPQAEQQAEHATPTTATNSVASTKETTDITHKSDMTTPTRRLGLVFSPPMTKTILSANTSDQL